MYIFPRSYSCCVGEKMNKLKAQKQKYCTYKKKPLLSAVSCYNYYLAIKLNPNYFLSIYGRTEGNWWMLTVSSASMKSSHLCGYIERKYTSFMKQYLRRTSHYFLRDTLQLIFWGASVYFSFGGELSLKSPEETILNKWQKLINGWCRLGTHQIAFTASRSWKDSNNVKALSVIAAPGEPGCVDPAAWCRT